MGRRLSPDEYEALRLRTLKVRRDNPDLDFGVLEKRLSMSRNTIGRWCTDAGLGVEWAEQQLARRSA